MTGKATQEASGPSTTAGWRPVEGEILDGKLAGVEQVWSDWTQSFYPMLEVAKDDGTTVNVHGFHHILRRAILSKRPKIGHRIIITYLGISKTKDDKRNVANYIVQ